MEKIFNAASVAGGVAGGILAWLFGGGDALIWTLVTLVILDYITGVVKGIYNAVLSSDVGRRGILKKVMLLIVVALANVVQQLIGGSVPVREIVIMFFVVNEGLSILENVAATGLPIPQKLKNVLLQLRDENNGGEDNG